MLKLESAQRFFTDRNDVLQDREIQQGAVKCFIVMDVTHGGEVSGLFLSLQETEEIQRKMEKCRFLVRTKMALLRC